MFRSRLRSLRNVTVQFWREKLGATRLLRPIPLVAAGIIMALLLIPLWRDRENAYFVIEPMRSEVLHAAVPGKVNDVLVHEGEQVRAGQALLRMNSHPLAASMADSLRQRTKPQRELSEAFNSELQGQSIGFGGLRNQNGALHFTRLAGEAESSLTVAAPKDGIVLTQDSEALLGQDVGSGQPLLELADDGPRAVRVYIPSAALERIPAGARLSLELPGRFSPVHLTLVQPGGDAVNLPQGLVAAQEYKGIKLPVFYTARMELPESGGSPGFGVSGRAIVFGIRRSLAGRAFSVVADLFKAHIWW